MRSEAEAVPSPKGPPPWPVYGHELILDLHGCDGQKFTRQDIERFCESLCELIDMELRPS